MVAAIKCHSFSDRPRYFSLIAAGFEDIRNEVEVALAVDEKTAGKYHSPAAKRDSHES